MLLNEMRAEMMARVQIQITSEDTKKFRTSQLHEKVDMIEKLMKQILKEEVFYEQSDYTLYITIS